MGWFPFWSVGKHRKYKSMLRKQGIQFRNSLHLVTLFICSERFSLVTSAKGWFSESVAVNGAAEVITRLKCQWSLIDKHTRPW